MDNLLNDDLLLVLNALYEYEQRTQQKRTLLGGWVIEDHALAPPGSLAEELTHLAPNLTQYADVSWCLEAKARAADMFGRTIHFEGRSLTSSHVAMLPSGSNALLLTLTFLRDHGVRTIYVSAPNYFATFQSCHHLGLHVEVIPPCDFLSCRLDYERIAATVCTPDSAYVLSNPAYSVGVEYTSQEIERLLAILPEQTYLLLDEVYLGLNWEHEAPWERSDFPARVIVLRSPSKIFLLYGVKLCFVIAPPEVITYIEMLSEFLSSVPGNFEEIGLAYIRALSAWDHEFQQNRIGELREWKMHTISRFAHNLIRLTPIFEEFDFYMAPINSGPYITVAVEQSRVNGFNAVQLAYNKGILFMTSNYYYHDNPDWFGFRMNLCGNSGEFARVLRRVLPTCLKTSD